jgi:hypothetical protein
MMDGLQSTLFASEKNIFPKMYITATNPVPNTNVTAIIPIQSVFILPPFLLNLSFLSKKTRGLNKDHGFSKITFASATRLSQELGTRGFPRHPSLEQRAPHLLR